METETAIIPKCVVDATHQGGYFTLWQHFVSEGMTQKAAWERVEDLLHKYGFPGRYSSYESFTTNKNKHLQKAIKAWLRFKTHGTK